MVVCPAMKNLKISVIFSPDVCCQCHSKDPKMETFVFNSEGQTPSVFETWLLLSSHISLCKNILDPICSIYECIANAPMTVKFVNVDFIKIPFL